MRKQSAEKDTHLVLIAYTVEDRLKSFCAKTREAQVSLLVGSHFADLSTLIENYLPKPPLTTLLAA